jgi:hypothetical protein
MLEQNTLIAEINRLSPEEATQYLEESIGTWKRLFSYSAVMHGHGMSFSTTFLANSYIDIHYQIDVFVLYIYNFSSHFH